MRDDDHEVIIVHIPTRSPAKRRATYHHGDLRKALIAAALTAIAEHGAEQFTLRDAARRAGVSPAAPYRHFADRDDLLAAVAADCMLRLGAAMDEAVAHAGTTDPLDVFRATGLAYVRFAVEHPAHFRVMSMPAVVARTPADVGAAMTATDARMIAALTAAQKAGQIARDPIDQLMMTASCAVHGLACQIVDRAHGYEDVDVERALELAEIVTGVIGTGLLPRASGDARSRPPPGRPGKRARRA